MKTISFRADMINLILTIKKTATIRPIKEQIDMFFLSDDFLKKIYYTWPGSHQLRSAGWIADQCPYGKVGDVIAVREYEEILLRITYVWSYWLDNLANSVWERAGLEDLSGESIRKHWDSFYGDTKFRYDKNPRVWVIEFELMVDNICSMKDLIHFVNSYDSIPPKNIQGAKANRSRANNKKGANK